MKKYIQLYEKFAEDTKDSQKMDEMYVNICKTQGQRAGILYLKNIGAKWLDIDNYAIRYRISEWTKNDVSAECKMDLLNELLNYDNVQDARIENNEKMKASEVVIDTNEGSIRALQLSSIMPKIKDKFPFIEGNERFGKCFEFAYQIALHIPIPYEIVTGYIYGYSDKAKFIHSWIETTINGNDYVMDGTLNAMINKDGYYMVQHAQPLKKISDQTFRSDMNQHLSKIEVFQLEAYYLFRNEFIEELLEMKKGLQK